jgi:hypothetical protein
LRPRPTAHARWRCGAVALLLGLLVQTTGARADHPVVTTLADYEDDSVAALIADVENVAESDCRVSVAAIPARGQRSLVVEIGATKPDASAACDLRFRLATPFAQADRVATYAWITQGAVELAFRVRDATGQLFETPPLSLRTRNRWVRLTAELSPKNLRPVTARGRRADSELSWPIQVEGYRIRVREIGLQMVYLDDLEVEHRVAATGMLRGEFKLARPTHIFEPGALVRAAIVLENSSRASALPLSVQMAWLRGDGHELTVATAPVNLPAAREGYRSRQPVDFTQRIDDPGLYRLLARARGPRWTTPAIFETTIAVSYSNRSLPRGRATFFGVQANLLREPAADQLLEIDMAREIGVQLLALETPWRVIEPSPGAFEFAALDGLINRITQHDIAPLLVLGDPPRWLRTPNTDFWDRQTALLEALAQRYRERVPAYQPLAPEPGRLTDADLAALAQIERRVSAVRSTIEICTPPVRVPSDDPTSVDLPRLPGDSRLQLAFETRGDSAAAIAALAEFARAHELRWTTRHRWFHRAEPLPDSGGTRDAVTLLRHYLRAAREGVAGLVWDDLRDDTSDPRFSAAMRGLVQRDFSPKSPLLSFANTVGMLHGLLYVGEAPGAGAEFESALFIGGQRQVMVLCPKPNRILPAVLVPYQTVEGDLAVFDFDRRLKPLTRSAAPPLAETDQTPFFLTLNALRAQSAPKLGLARPWLRVPAAVYCASQATFRIELDAPVHLRRSYLQVILPDNAPVTSSLSSRSLRAEAGHTLSLDVTLTHTGNDPWRPVDMTIRLRLEGTSLAIPVTVHPLATVEQLGSSGQIGDPRFRLGRLARPDAEDDSVFSAPLHAAYDRSTLHLAVALPPGSPADATLHLGLALEGADTHSEISAAGPAHRPHLLPTRGTPPDRVASWHSQVADMQTARGRLFQLTIPARSLGLSSFQPGTRLLLAARYAEPQPGSAAAPLTLEWGRGLTGGRSTTGYRWLELGEEDPD